MSNKAIDETHCDKHGCFYTEYAPCVECENEKLKQALSAEKAHADMLATASLHFMLTLKAGASNETVHEARNKLDRILTAHAERRGG